MTELEIRILEVATWILKVNPQFEYNYFRSNEIRSIWTTNARANNNYPLTSATSIVKTAARRREALLKMDIKLLSLEEVAASGSLIYTNPEQSELDGGAEFYSQGLVDIWAVPAWDTWVAFGASEFKEFNRYPEAVISWIPNTVDSLFFSGRAVSIKENMGWLKLDVSNMFLLYLAKEPANLEFVETADKDEGEIFKRLRIINGWETREKSETSRGLINSIMGQ